MELGGSRWKLKFPWSAGAPQTESETTAYSPRAGDTPEQIQNRGGTEFTLYRNNVGPLLFPTASPNKLDDLSKRWVALGATLDGRLNSP